MKANLIEFRKREKYINEIHHPSMDLIIWNYTSECQFAKAWDKYTSMCRGLITDSSGEIVARPFKKFFNWGEDLSISIPINMPIISEKMDGSLGVQYYDGDNVLIATRGNFDSEQARWATGYMSLVMKLKKSDFLPNKTYLWEIIYPENRIVVDYKGREDLILLAIIDNETGDETFRSVEDEAKRLEVSCAPRIKAKSIEEIVESTKTLSGNEEGYVFHWPHHDNLRIKVKGKEYVRLHKLLTEFSTKSLWETLKVKASLNEVLDRVPDEFYDWVRQEEDKLIKEYDKLFNAATDAYKKVMTLSTRKEQAIEIKKNYVEVSSLVFAMLDGKDPSPIIWKEIRPKYEKPLYKDIDN